jgi:NADPH:quinone reductase-like Zn-dependent oxidoreductase
MRAVVISIPGPPEVLRIEERAKPALGETDVLIQVKAAGVNRADLIQREGHYPAPPGVPEDIPGLEVAGVIESTGSKVQRWKSGDAVCALLAGGGYAGYVVVNGGQCLPIPRGLSFTEPQDLVGCGVDGAGPLPSRQWPTDRSPFCPCFTDIACGPYPSLRNA